MRLQAAVRARVRSSIATQFAFFCEMAATELARGKGQPLIAALSAIEETVLS